MLLQYILHLFGLLICLSQALPSWLPTENGIASILRRAPGDNGATRNVNLRLYFSYDTRSTKPNGLTNFAWHTALEIDGTKTDPSIKMDISFDGENWVFRQWLNSDRPPQSNEKLFPQGTTTLTNKGIIADNGGGPAWDALVADPEYRTGPSNAGRMNTCHNFASRMLENMGIKVTDEAQKWMTAYDTQTSTADETKPVKSLLVIETKQGAKRPTQIKEYKVPAGGKGKGCKKRAGACVKPDIVDGGEKHGEWKNELITLKDKSMMVPEDFTDPVVDSSGNAKVPSQDMLYGPKGAKVGFARAGGVLKTFSMVGKEALGALGVAGNVLGPIFVILDFVGHDWVGGAIGAVGLVAGAVAGVALSGPIGWVVGGAIMALFASMSSS